MRRHLLEVRIFFLVPSALLLIGALINFFLPRRNEPYLIWAGYSLVLYHLAIFGLLTVLTPLSSHS